MKREAEGAPARGHRDTGSNDGCGTAHAITHAVSAADKSVAFEAPPHLRLGGGGSREGERQQVPVGADPITQ